MDRWHRYGAVQRWRMAQRDHGRRALRRMTGWLAALAIGLAAVFGAVFAHEHASTASGAGDTGGSTVQQQDDGGTDDDNGGATQTVPGIQPPVQAPGNVGTGGGSHVQSGGS